MRTTRTLASISTALLISVGLAPVAGSSPASTASPTSSNEAVSISLETSKPLVPFDGSFVLTGAISSSTGSCLSTVPVLIRRTAVGQSSQEDVAHVTTTSQGTFSIDRVGDVSAQYIAVIEDSAGCGAVSSTPVPVNVKVKIGFALSKTKIQQGRSVTLDVRIAPCDSSHAATKVVFYKGVDGILAAFQSVDLSRSCTASIRVRPFRDTLYQARYAKQDSDHDGGSSKSKTVKVV